MRFGFDFLVNVEDAAFGEWFNAMVVSSLVFVKYIPVLAGVFLHFCLVSPNPFILFQFLLPFAPRFRPELTRNRHLFGFGQFVLHLLDICEVET